MKHRKIINFISTFLLMWITCVPVFASEGKSEGGGENKVPVAVDKSRYLLATSRGGDFPYIGGFEALDILLTKLSIINPLIYKGSALEIGGGHGGNANYLKIHGLEKIQVIDIDEEAVNYAKAKYPAIDFKLLDAKKITSAFEDNSFDLIYMLGSAHAVSDPLVLLQKLKAISKSGALVAIMDYNLKSAKETDKIDTPSGEAIHALNTEKLTTMMGYIGLEVIETVDITQLYKNWYISVLSILNLSKNDLLTKGYSEAEIILIVDKFNFMLSMLEEGKIGGILLIARKI